MCYDEDTQAAACEWKHSQVVLSLDKTFMPMVIMCVLSVKMDVSHWLPMMTPQHAYSYGTECCPYVHVYIVCASKDLPGNTPV